MAWTTYTVADRKQSPHYREFVCDTVDDIKDLPTNIHMGNIHSKDDNKKLCSTGSIAIVIDTSDVYMLNSEGEWKLI